MTFFSIAYSCRGHLSAIVFVVFVAFLTQKKKKFFVNLGDPCRRGSPIKINGGTFTLIIVLCWEFDKYKKILLNLGVQGMSNQ